MRLLKSDFIPGAMIRFTNGYDYWILVIELYDLECGDVYFLAFWNDGSVIEHSLEMFIESENLELIV